MNRAPPCAWETALSAHGGAAADEDAVVAVADDDDIVVAVVVADDDTEIAADDEGMQGPYGFHHRHLAMSSTEIIIQKRNV